GVVWPPGLGSLYRLSLARRTSVSHGAAGPVQAGAGDVAYNPRGRTAAGRDPSGGTQRGRTMNEIEVVLDVRQVPGSLDLVVVRQKLAMDGGQLRPVGQPSEARVALAIRKAKVTLSMRSGLDKERYLIAHVQNLGLAPLSDLRVAFHSTSEPRPAGL